MSVFNCFNKVNTLSNSISSGSFDGDCNKMADEGKGALGDVTSAISLLKKPTDALTNLGNDKIGPLFKGPIGTAKKGGNLKQAVSKMLDSTKKIFGSGAQDALKGSTQDNQVSQQIEQKVNKKFNLFLESRCFHRKQSHTLRHIENAFRSLIQQHVLNAHDPRSMYYNLDHTINIQTSTSNITVKKQANHTLIYEEHAIGKIAKPTIITENVLNENIGALNQFIKERLSLSPKANRSVLQKTLAKEFGVSVDQINSFGTTSVHNDNKRSSWSLSVKGIDKLRRANPDKFKELFGNQDYQSPSTISKRMQDLKGNPNITSWKSKDKPLPASNDQTEPDKAQAQNANTDTNANSNANTDTNANTEANVENTNSQNNDAEAQDTTNASATSTTIAKAGKDAKGRQRGSLSRKLEAKKKVVGKKIKNFGKKIWGFIKKIYRPLYNLLVYIASLLIRLVFAIGRFVVSFIVKPVLGLFMPGAGPETLEKTINNWLTKMSDIKIKFTLTKDITAEVQQTGKVISKLLKWTAFAGCTGITIWLAANVMKLLKSDIPNSDIVTNVTPDSNAASEADPFA